MRIGVLTSGGDAPGMNAAVRTVTVVGTAQGHEIYGIRRGYEGLLEGDAVRLEPADVAGMSRFGGTILGSARSKTFPTAEGRARARAMIGDLGLEGLVVVGGNGSLAGAHLLAEASPCRIVGLPASIDNDIGHTAMAIGADTAVNTIVDACDRISDTARAHRRIFVVEVMGRQSGFLAMRAGICAEADAILYGEDGRSIEAIVEQLRAMLRRSFGPGTKKLRVLIVKAEGVPVSARELTEQLQRFSDAELGGIDVRETVLGHVVRGGSPSALDRMIAQRLAFAAVVACERGAHDVMMGWDVPFDHGKATKDGHVRMVPLVDVLEETTKLLDGTSPVVRGRLALLERVQDILSF